jgi:hypothetical protein
MTHRPRLFQFRPSFLVGVLVALFFVVVSLVRLAQAPVNETAEPAMPLADAALALATEPVGEDVALTTDRPIYPYSIIQRGAPTPAVLRGAVEADPVVRTHYAQFNLARTHVVRLTQPYLAHVSYRIGNDVFWTRRPLLLKAGETMLTDGEHYARTRCGNQLAVAPGAVSVDEPAAEALDTPLQPLLPLQGVRQFPSVILPLAVARASGFASDLSLPWAVGSIPSIPSGPINSIPTGPGAVSGRDPGLDPGGAPAVPTDGGYTDSPSNPTPPDPLPPTGEFPPIVNKVPPVDPVPPTEIVPPTDTIPPIVTETPVPPSDPPPTTTQVPEPGTMWLALAGAGLLLRRRHGRVT